MFWNIKIEDAIKNISFRGNKNRDSLHFLTHNGKTQTIKQWSKELDIKYNTLFMRIRNGWKIKDALTIPVRNKK